MRPRIHSRFDSEGHVQSTLHEREQVISEREAVYSRGLSDHGRDGQADAVNQSCVEQLLIRIVCQKALPLRVLKEPFKAPIAVRAS